MIKAKNNKIAGIIVDMKEDLKNGVNETTSETEVSR
jgi:hypothetical protein